MNSFTTEELKDIYLGFLDKWKDYKWSSANSLIDKQYEADRKVMREIALILDQRESRV